MAYRGKKVETEDQFVKSFSVASNAWSLSKIRNEIYRFRLHPLHVSTIIIHPQKVPYISGALIHKLQGVTPCNLCQIFL
jgi:hypothetical protein